MRLPTGVLLGISYHNQWSPKAMQAAKPSRALCSVYKPGFVSSIYFQDMYVRSNYYKERASENKVISPVFHNAFPLLMLREYIGISTDNHSVRVPDPREECAFLLERELI